MAHAHDLPGSQYQVLALEHHSLDERLHYFATLPHLTTKQHLEEVTLKKQKLAIKDQMSRLIAARRH
jgi:uncharacterized protein YdcH (DUF465 family)